MKSASGLTAGKLDLAWLEGTSDRQSSFSQSSLSKGSFDSAEPIGAIDGVSVVQLLVRRRAVAVFTFLVTESALNVVHGTVSGEKEQRLLNQFSLSIVIALVKL